MAQIVPAVDPGSGSQGDDLYIWLLTQIGPHVQLSGGNRDLYKERHRELTGLALTTTLGGHINCNISWDKLALVFGTAVTASLD